MFVVKKKIHLIIMTVFGIFSDRAKWQEKVLNRGYSELTFPIMFYDLEYKYPRYKVLENRTLNFEIFESFDHLIEYIDEVGKLKSFVRMIDSRGNEYHTEYSKKLKIILPLEKMRQIKLEQLLALLEPYIKDKGQNVKVKIVQERTISSLLYFLFEMGNGFCTK
jgi:hypothetical protein